MSAFATPDSTDRTPHTLLRRQQPGPGPRRCTDHLGGVGHGRAADRACRVGGDQEGDASGHHRRRECCGDDRLPVPPPSGLLGDLVVVVHGVVHVVSPFPNRRRRSGRRRKSSHPRNASLRARRLWPLGCCIVYDWWVTGLYAVTIFQAGYTKPSGRCRQKRSSYRRWKLH